MIYVRSALLVCVLLTAVEYSQSQSTAPSACSVGNYPITATGTTPTDQQTILALHNNARNQLAGGQMTAQNGATLPTASNMNPLVWNQELANAAQSMTETCVFAHNNTNTTTFGQNYGQNIFLAMSTRSTPAPDWTAPMGAFINEKQSFPVSNISPFKSENSYDHFSQVVWAPTTLIGCGVTAFTNINNSFPFQYFYTCNYYIPGNIIGASMYTTGSPCTACSSCSTTYPNLCGSPPNSSYGNNLR